jgi:hypothetical protein
LRRTFLAKRGLILRLLARFVAGVVAGVLIVELAIIIVNKP